MFQFAAHMAKEFHLVIADAPIFCCLLLSLGWVHLPGVIPI